MEPALGAAEAGKKAGVGVGGRQRGTSLATQWNLP